MNSTTITFLAGVLSFGLTFLSFGVLWAGVNQWFQSIVTLIFLLSSFLLSKKINKRNLIFSMLIGALPLGKIMLMFRDKNDSHLLGISIVSSWVVAIVIGTLKNKSQHT